MISVVDLELLCGTEISKATDKAISIAKQLNTRVSFSFNGIKVYVVEGTDAESVVDAYHAVKANKGFIVGDKYPVLYLPYETREKLEYTGGVAAYIDNYIESTVWGELE